VNRGLTTGLPHTLVALPVIVSLVFCFGFVMMTDKPSNGHASSHSSPLTAAPPSSLPTIELHNEDPLPIITAGSNASLSATFGGLNASSPQSSNGNGRTNLQSQNNSSQSILNSLGNSLNGVLNQKY
jgi:hypothetical protein